MSKLIIYVHPSWKHHAVMGDYIRDLIAKGDAVETKPITRECAEASLKALRSAGVKVGAEITPQQSQPEGV